MRIVNSNSNFSENSIASGKNGLNRKKLVLLRNVEMEIIDSNSLVAFQGPQAVNVLQRFTKYDLSSLGFFYMDDMEIEGKFYSKSN